MTEFQQTLFDQPPPSKPVTAPYIPGSDTSRLAAEAVTPKAGRLQRLVYDFIRECGVWGATDPEIAAALAMQPDTARARRCELRDGGYIGDSGDRRLSPAGRAATVWVTTDKPFPEPVAP